MRGDLYASAGRDINIEAGQSTSAVDEMAHSTRSSTFGSTTSTGRITADQTNAIASSLGGHTVTLDAGRNINVRGSNVVSDTGTELWAGNNITIEAAQESRNKSILFERSSSGFLDSGADIGIGSQKQRNTRDSQETRAAGSTIGAIAGDVFITAGNRYSQIGSDVIAPVGDIDILAKDVQITEARETYRSQSTSSYSQSGLMLGAKVPFLDTLREVNDTARAMGDTSDDRMRALGTASIAMNGYSTYKDIAQAAATGVGTGAVNMGVTLSVGSSSSESASRYDSDTAAGSRLQAGGNVIVNATGGGRDSNILIRGSEINAGRNVELSADNAITIEAARSTQNQSSSYKSKNASVGVGMSFGEQANGITLEVDAGNARGNDSGTDVGYTASRINAGNTVSLNSGGDTTIRGSTVAGHRVEAEVGGSLRIETMQETSTYQGQNSGNYFDASVCIYMCSGGGASAGTYNTKGEGNYASAVEQSGIRAGDGGFDVNVKGDTTLVGSVISSTQKAVDENRNNFHTDGTLTLTDLHNSDTFEGSGYAVNVSTSTEGNSAGIGSKDVHQSSTTQSGISGIAGNTEVRTGTDTTNGLTPTNVDQVTREVGAQITITEQFLSQSASC